MAFVHLPRKSPQLLALALAVAAITVPLATGAGATPQKPKPTVASVTAKLDQLANRAEAVTEKYNAARLDVQRRERAAQAARRDASDAIRRYEAARGPLVQLITAQYESGPTSGVSSLLTSDDPGGYLDTLAMQDLLARRFASVLAQVDAARQSAARARQTAEAALARARATRAALGEQRAAVIAETAKFRKLLAGLTAAQQAAYTSRGAVTPTQAQAAFKVHAGSAAAQKAVDFALAQIGKPYVWAAAGPDAYDCSGLTMAAWARGGVSLPHLASAQYNYGRHVSYSELQPGDLVFLYSDIHHVEIYVGKGLAVSAPQEGEDVKFVRVADDLADFYGATRLT